MERQFELGHEEGVEDVPRLAQRQLELAHDAGELVDHAQRLVALRLPAAVETAVHAEVADGLCVRDGLHGVALDADASSLQIRCSQLSRV
jgi:hypothetical protein